MHLPQRGSKTLLRTEAGNGEGCGWPVTDYWQQREHHAPKVYLDPSKGCSESLFISLFFHQKHCKSLGFYLPCCPSVVNLCNGKYCHPLKSTWYGHTCKYGLWPDHLLRLTWHFNWLFRLADLSLAPSHGRNPLALAEGSAWWVCISLSLAFKRVMWEVVFFPSLDLTTESSIQSLAQPPPSQEGFGQKEHNLPTWPPWPGFGQCVIG